MKKYPILLGLLCILFCFMGCKDKPKKEGLLFGVVTTTGMIGDLVTNIGGEHIAVTALMGSGVDPHLYRASEGDITRLVEADLIFYNGLHLEAKMGGILEKMANKRPVVAVSDLIPQDKFLDFIGYRGFYDPHIWFDVQLWILATDSVLKALSEALPEHKADFEKNAVHYLEQLYVLDAYIKDAVAQIPKSNRVLVTAHDAFSYFGNAYGVEVKGLQGISTASEAGTRDVQELAEFIVRRKIPAIFIESSVPERNIKAVQKAVASRGWQVKIGGELFSDAMGLAGTVEGTYIGMVTHNVDIIVSALKGESK